MKEIDSPKWSSNFLNSTLIDLKINEIPHDTGYTSSLNISIPVGKRVILIGASIIISIDSTSSDIRISYFFSTGITENPLLITKDITSHNINIKSKSGGNVRFLVIRV